MGRRWTSSGYSARQANREVLGPNPNGAAWKVGKSPEKGSKQLHRRSFLAGGYQEK